MAVERQSSWFADSDTENEGNHQLVSGTCSVHAVVFGGVQHIQHTSTFDKHAQNNWRSLSHMLTVPWFPWGRMRTITLQALIAMHARWLVPNTTHTTQHAVMNRLYGGTRKQAFSRKPKPTEAMQRFHKCSLIIHPGPWPWWGHSGSVPL